MEIINTIHCKVCNVMQYNIKAGENNTVKVVGGNGEEKAKEKGSSHSRDYILVIVVHPLGKQPM